VFEPEFFKSLFILSFDFLIDSLFFFLYLLRTFILFTIDSIFK
jgi:hypothetical protein